MIWLDAMEANEQGDREVALALAEEVVSLDEAHARIPSSTRISGFTTGVVRTPAAVTAALVVPVATSALAARTAVTAALVVPVATSTPPSASSFSEVPTRMSSPGTSLTRLLSRCDLDR